jgi:hypothetical protein
VKRLQNNRKTLGLLSAFLMVLPFIIGIEHVYRYSVDDVGEQSYGHDCSTCEVCRFSFSLFTENESFELKKTLQYVEYEIPVFDSQITASLIFSYYLRGPPF